jgi:hypothetical protein
MKTAVKWLVEEINKQKAWANPQQLEPLINYALKIEKEQMFDFFLKGYSIGESDFNPKLEANKYYNETYKQE